MADFFKDRKMQMIMPKSALPSKRHGSVKPDEIQPPR